MGWSRTDERWDVARLTRDGMEQDRKVELKKARRWVISGLDIDILSLSLQTTTEKVYLLQHPGCVMQRPLCGSEYE